MNGQKINYQKKTDAVLQALRERGERPRLLLHACCGPCASSVLEYLQEYFDIDVYFLNSNILPEEEYQRRLRALELLLSRLPTRTEVGLITPTYDPDSYLTSVRGLESEPEGGARCTVCIGDRIDATAAFAAREGYDFFATTLTVSPHKNAELINALGYAAAERHGSVWLPSDFKKRGGYLRSIELCREFGIYRQSYCGCGLGVGE